MSNSAAADRLPHLNEVPAGTELRSPRAAPFAQSGKDDMAGFALVARLALLHLVMLVYDGLHPESFLNADRAEHRSRMIAGFRDTLLGEGDLVAYVTSHGIVGDWLPHALLHLAGGPPLIIGVQVLLTLASVLWVREIGLRAGLAARPAGLAALLYGLLPHTLVFPHQLATEALFVPLVVWGFVLTARSLDRRAARHGRATAEDSHAAALAGRSGGRFAAAGLAIGMATLLRPVTMLWSPVQALLMPISWPRRCVFVAIGLAPLMLWMSFMFATTGRFTMGASDHDLGHNLYQRVERMSPRPANADFPPGTESLSVGQYLGWSIQNPDRFLAHSARDTLTLGVKSGVERFVLDYLSLFPEARSLQESNTGWRAMLEREGPVAALRSLLAGNALPTLIALAGALAFACLMLLALLGAWDWLRGTGASPGTTPTMQALRLLCIAFVLYVLATAQVVDAAQSRHRAPAEFALCLLAMAGWTRWKLRRERAHG